MRSVFINGRFLTQVLTGVQRYSRELVRALDLLVEAQPDPDTEWVLLCPPKAELPPLRAVRSVTVGGATGHLWEQTRLAAAARGSVVVSLGNSGPLWHRRQLVVIHDASVFRTPENYGRPYRIAHRTLTRLLSRTAQLATVSRFSQQELAEILRLPPEVISVVPDGVACSDERGAYSSVQTPLGLNGNRYLLYVGSLAPNKNLARAVEAFELVRQPDEKLVIVGSVATNVFKQSIPVAGEHIVLAGRVSDDELKTLYRHAVALIFPSIYEGFGLPPLEAMAHGCVVLASNIEPVREVCAEAAVYFDPFAPEQIASVFRQALSGTFDRARLVRAGRQRASLYTWQASAEALRCTVYKILDKGTGR